MILSKSRGVVVDYLGTHQHLAVDIHCEVDDQGAMCIRSGEQRFYEGPIAFRFPLLFSGVAHVREWWDEAAERFHIDVNVSNRVFGPLFGYRGSFTVVERPCSEADIPWTRDPFGKSAGSERGHPERFHFRHFCSSLGGGGNPQVSVIAEPLWSAPLG